MNRRIIGCCTILGLCTVFCAPPLAAGWWHPRRRMPQYQQPTAESVSLQGTVQSITPTHIEVLVDSSTDGPKKKNPKTPHGTWSVVVPHETPIQVSGEATPDYLHHGLMVRFTVEGKEKEKKQEAAETTHELTIVTAASHKAISKDSSVSLQPANQKQETGRTVTGQLGHLHNNQWSVIAEGRTWHIELADDVKIKVAFTGSHFVKPGDKISVQGEMIHGKPGTCTANNVQVTLAQPLTASKSSQKQAASEPKNEKKD